MLQSQSPSSPSEGRERIILPSVPFVIPSSSATVSVTFSLRRGAPPPPPPPLDDLLRYATSPRSGRGGRDGGHATRQVPPRSSFCPIKSEV